MTLVTVCLLAVLGLQICSTDAFTSRIPVLKSRNLSPYSGLRTYQQKQASKSHHRHVPLLSTSDDSESLQNESDSGMDDEDNYMGSNQYDEYEMAGQPQDAEMIEAMRLERIIANDRWQSCLIRDRQGGEWTGSYEMYTPKKGPKGFLLSKADSGTVRTSLTPGIFDLTGVPIFFDEKYTSTAPLSGSDKETAAHSLLLAATRKQFLPGDFRPSLGNQVVANVYSTCSVVETTPLDAEKVCESYVTEIAVREGCLRTRVRYAYTSKLTSAMEEGEKTEGNYDIFLAGIAILRECLVGTALPDVQPLFDVTPGSGIYDPQVSGEPYVQINFPGKLSLLFPRGISNVLNKAGHAITMEWEGKDMRYQVDRRFCELSDGNMRSLELTEVRAADATTYPAGFAIKPDYMQYNN